MATAEWHEDFAMLNPPYPRPLSAASNPARRARGNCGGCSIKIDCKCSTETRRVASPPRFRNNEGLSFAERQMRGGACAPRPGTPQPWWATSAASRAFRIHDARAHVRWRCCGCAKSLPRPREAGCQFPSSGGRARARAGRATTHAELRQANPERYRS